MSIVIKSPEEIEKMRVAGRLAAEVLEMIEPHVKAGISTGEIDRICHDYIVNVQQAIPAPLDYHGFPKATCTSINEVVCHGIPSNERILQDGDIVNIDITVIKDGYHGDTSKMFYIGEISPIDKRLCLATQEFLYEGIRKVKPGAKFGEIGTHIENLVKKKRKSGARYSIVEEYCGHGIGAAFHEEPQVVHYKNSAQATMKPGMCFTIEPMINAGRKQTKLDKDDGWTVYTIDGKKSAQWEHTILVTETGCEILTLRSEEKISRIIDNS